MANKRMFSKDIVGSDAFQDMPASSQLLYFHLGMEADDDGFIGNPKKIARGIGMADDDMKILLAKRFVLIFPSGVLVLKHHRINNNWDKYNCKRTVYMEEFTKLYIKENKAYTMDKTQGIPLQSENSLKTVFRIEENRIDKKRREETKREKSAPDRLELHISYLKGVPEGDVAEFVEKFRVNRDQVASKAADLIDWCESNGKHKKNYKAFLRVAIKKDFGLRTEGDKELDERIRRTKESMEAGPSTFAQSLKDKMKMR